MTSQKNMMDWSETMALRDKNLFTEKLNNLLLSETFIGGQLENHGRIKKVWKKLRKKSAIFS